MTTKLAEKNARKWHGHCKAGLDFHWLLISFDLLILNFHWFISAGENAFSPVNFSVLTCIMHYNIMSGKVTLLSDLTSIVITEVRVILFKNWKTWIAYQHNFYIASPCCSVKRGVFPVIMCVDFRFITQKTLDDIQLLRSYSTVQWSFAILIVCIYICKNGGWGISFYNCPTKLLTRP